LIGIIGSGNVGANTAFFLLEKGVEEVALYDIRDGLAAGKALDMMEAAPIRAYAGRLRALTELGEIAGSDIVVLAAGAVRRPGMKRQELFASNRPVVEELAPRIARLVPFAKVIVVTEPVDAMTRVFVSASGMSRRQVMGLGGYLDATRLRNAIAQRLQVSADDVAALVLGVHGDEALFLPRYCRVAGVPVETLLPVAELQELIEESRRAGDLIVQLAQRSSAYYAPSAAVAEVAAAIRRDLRRILPVSVALEGEYGLTGLALSLPCIVGREGIEKVLQPQLTDAERDRLLAAAAAAQQVLQGGGA
jgi:malate dehydrogenase